MLVSHNRALWFKFKSGQACALALKFGLLRDDKKISNNLEINICTWKASVHGSKKGEYIKT